jgi:hypothetical protein
MIKNSDDIDVNSLFNGRKPFRVPPYQRAYAWEAEEVGDFVNDILGLYQAKTRSSASTMKHFFGGLVTIYKAASGSVSGRVSEVVDGQQRLATFLMAFNLVVRALAEVSTLATAAGDSTTATDAANYSDQTREDLVTYSEVEPGRGRVPRLRLTLSKADQVFFENLLAGTRIPIGRDSHRRLQSAEEQIHEGLVAPILNAASSPSDKLRDLLTLKSCLADDCHAIHIESDDPKEAHRLFSILNDRGKTLSDGDHLRSFTLELLEGHQIYQNQAEQHWDHILAETQPNIDKFLRGYYPSHAGRRAPQRDLYDSFKEEFFSYPPPPLSAPDAQRLEQEIAKIRNEFDVFAKLRDGEWPFDSSTVPAWDRDRLARLIRLLKHELCLPLLLSAYFRWSTDEQKFSEMVVLIERFVFRYITIIKARPSRLADKYYQHAKALRNTSVTYNLADLEQDLRALINAEADDSLFLRRLDEVFDYGESSRRKIIRHFLTTIEDCYDWLSRGGTGKPDPLKTRVWDLDQNTIEHIYPQNPAIRIPALETVKNRIGNLSFWGAGENNAAANDPFTSKKSRYASSTVKLNNELSSLPDWDYTSYEHRRDQLLQRALKVFKI